MKTLLAAMFVVFLLPAPTAEAGCRCGRSYISDLKTCHKCPCECAKCSADCRIPRMLEPISAIDCTVIAVATRPATVAP